MEHSFVNNRRIGALRAAVAFLIIAGLAFFVLGYNRIVERQRYINPILVVADGDGSANNPFLIDSEEQFISFRNSVNRGYYYDECYFLQTADLDFREIRNWIPIGPENTPFYFRGYYDGGGHTIRGITCDSDEGDTVNVALFGRLAGTIINLGIEESTFQGENAASIAYTSFGEDARIINCYSIAEIIAQNAGSGIAHSFSGYIANCWFGGVMQGKRTAAISAVNPIAIFSCYGQGSLYTDNFTQYVSSSRTDIANQEVAFFHMNGSIADCARYLRMESADFVVWR